MRIPGPPILLLLLGAVLVINIVFLLSNFTRMSILRETVAEKDDLISKLTFVPESPFDSAEFDTPNSEQDIFVRELYSLINGKGSHRWLLREVYRQISNKKFVDFQEPNVKLALSDAIFASQREVAIRNADRIKSNGDWAKFYQLFVPTITCPIMHRFGRSGDGGKFLCNPHKLFRLPHTCRVYGFGVEDDLSFELDMENLVDCEVHAFDPTIEKLPKGGNSISFHPIGLGPVGIDVQKGVPLPKIIDVLSVTRTYGLEMKTLLEIAEQLDHAWVDILKMDIEGAEMIVLRNLINTNALEKLGVKIVLLEYHGFVSYKELPNGYKVRLSRPSDTTRSPKLQLLIWRRDEGRSCSR